MVGLMLSLEHHKIFKTNEADGTENWWNANVAAYNNFKAWFDEVMKLFKLKWTVASIRKDLPLFTGTALYTCYNKYNRKDRDDPLNICWPEKAEPTQAERENLAGGMDNDWSGPFMAQAFETLRCMCTKIKHAKALKFKADPWSDGIFNPANLIAD